MQDLAPDPVLFLGVIEVEFLLGQHAERPLDRPGQQGIALPLSEQHPVGPHVLVDDLADGTEGVLDDVLGECLDHGTQSRLAEL